MKIIGILIISILLYLQPPAGSKGAQNGNCPTCPVNNPVPIKFGGLLITAGIIFYIFKKNYLDKTKYE